VINDCNSSGNAANLVVPEIKFTKHFINGEFVDPVSGTHTSSFFSLAPT
jgi:coniferyl-aldehyde dehydrogenase